MRRIIFAIITFAILSFSLSPSAFAKSYTIDNADIAIQINPDGSADAKETRTYTFDGHYENGEWNIDTTKNKIDHNSIVLLENETEYRRSSVLSPGSYSVSSTSDKIIVRWKYSADNETRQFTVKYKIQNAVGNFADTAEFYWKFIGTGWSVPTGNVTALVTLPFSAPDTHLKAWGHGPLDGNVSIKSSQEIEFTVSSLPSSTFMEGRIVFPSLPGVTQLPQNKLEEIIEEEAGFINQTIGESKRQEMNTKFITIILSLIALVYFLRFFYWLYIWFQHGKEPKLPQINLAGSLHEPPSNLEPALVDALLSTGFKPSTKSITATILELCRKKIIKITQQKKSSLLGLFHREPEIVFEITADPELTRTEKGVVDLLYLNTHRSITKTEIQSKLKTDTGRLAAWNAWRDEVHLELTSNNFLDSQSQQYQSKIIWDIILAIVFAVVAIILTQQLGSAFAGKDIIAVGILIESGIFLISLLFLYYFLDKKTPKGATEVAGWKAFKKYLRAYSVTKNYPLESVIIWEKYIVYGAALGISLKALSQLPLKFAAAQNSSYLYAAGLTDKGGLNFDRLSSGFNALSASYGASGSGSSGGFSGGGGGGGGGSGGGMS